MTARIKIPTCWEHEDGFVYYVEGHVSPEMAVLSAITSTMIMVGAPEAMQMLVGGPVTGVNGDGWLVSDQFDMADDAVNSTAHIWMRPLPFDDENMYVCDAADEGASPWTIVRLT